MKSHLMAPIVRPSYVAPTAMVLQGWRGNAVPRPVPPPDAYPYEGARLAVRPHVERSAVSYQPSAARHRRVASG